MNSKKSRMMGFTVLVCIMSNAAAGAEPQAILHVLPTEESLGQHWRREVSLLFDPLSKPAVITPEASTLPASFKNEQIDAVANPQSYVSGWGNAQYTLHLTNGPAVYDVQIYRYRDRQRLAEEFDQLLRLDSEQYQHSPVKGLGDAAVFYRDSQATGSTVWFRSAEFKVPLFVQTTPPVSQTVSITCSRNGMGIDSIQRRIRDDNVAHFAMESDVSGNVSTDPGHGLRLRGVP